MPPALTWSELSAGRGRVVATMVVSGRLQNRCSNLWSVKRGDACRHEHAAAVIWDWSRGNSSSDLDLRIRGRNSRGNSLSDLIWISELEGGYLAVEARTIINCWEAECRVGPITTQPKNRSRAWSWRLCLSVEKVRPIPL